MQAGSEAQKRRLQRAAFVKSRSLPAAALTLEASLLEQRSRTEVQLHLTVTVH